MSDLLQIIQGDALTELRNLPDESVQCCVTSPPYWGLRDYGTAAWEGGDSGCSHEPPQEWIDHNFNANSAFGTGTATQSAAAKGRWFKSDGSCRCGAKRIDSQIGLEKTPEEYVRKMVEVFRELRRVLRKDGTLWLNLGDSYVGGKGASGQGSSEYQAARSDVSLNKPYHQIAGPKQTRALDDMASLRGSGLKPKDLCGIPWRVAFALQADGWWLRSDIIWCLSGGTWIYAKTQKGEMPMMIRDAARLDPATVKLWNGEKWTQVVGWSRTSRNADELEIVLRSGERISCTPAHQFPTSNGLKTASELKSGDVLQSVTLPNPPDPYSPDAVTLDAAWFLGLYLAEGSRSGSAIQIAGHASELDRVERLRKVSEFYGGTLKFDVHGNNLSIRLYGRLLHALINQYISGNSAHDKALKVRAWSHGNVWLGSLLQGYLAGDGHYDKENNRWRLGFCRNYYLERDLRVLAARLDFTLTLNLSTATSQVGNFPSFRGEIRFVKSDHGNVRSRNEIVEIRKARCREVYDIGVEDEPHVFALASGVLTHNSKPNPMPESVIDRPTKSHEYLFLLTKSANYFYDAEAIKEPSQDFTNVRTPNGDGSEQIRKAWVNHKERDPKKDLASWGSKYGSLVPAGGRNKRSVWTVATAPYPEAHFATYPPDLIKPCIMAGTSAKGCCARCGAPWERVVERGSNDPFGSGDLIQGKQREWKRSSHCGANDQIDYEPPKTLGWQPTCKCDAGVDPCTVLDPFPGSGTTGAVALELGRKAVLIELNPAYVELIEQRCSITVGLALA